MTAVTDPQDFVYIDPLPDRQRRRNGRRVRIADKDWQAAGDPAAPGGTEGRLRVEVTVNNVPLQIELQLQGLAEGASRDRRADEGGQQSPMLRVRGRAYDLVAVRAV